MNAREMRSLLATLIDQAENRLNAGDNAGYDQLIAQMQPLKQEIDQREAKYPRHGLGENRAGSVPGTIMGDSETRAIAAFVRGDRSALQDLAPSGDDTDFEIRLPRINELRAVDSIMNITTGADGGSAVPTGFAGTIALRMSEISIDEKLGVRPVPGVGTTVNYPFESSDPSVFADTAEQDDSYAQTYQRDVAPVLGSKSFTLAKKTKKLALTEELLDDEDANLMSSIADTIGRAVAATRNAMLLTEVAANGTLLKTFAGAAALAFGEPEDMLFNDALSYYLDDNKSIGWVMRPTTHGTLQTLQGDSRLYENQLGAGRRELLNYPIVYSNAAAAIGASSKSIFVGNWYMVGRRLDPALKFLRDPYTTDGITYLKYSMRLCFGVLVAPGIGFGQHPTG